MGSLTHQVTNVYLRNLDGEAEYERLQAKLGAEGELDEADMVRLIFLPLMKNEQRESEVVLAAAEMAKGIKTQRQTFVLGSIIAMGARYLNESDLARLMEVLKMTQIEQMIRKDNAEAIATKALMEGLSPEKVAKITDLPLEKVLELKKKLEC